MSSVVLRHTNDASTPPHSCAPPRRVHSIETELAILSEVLVKREQAKSKSAPPHLSVQLCGHSLPWCVCVCVCVSVHVYRRKMPEREATSHRSTAEPKPAKKRRTHTDTPPPLSRVEDKVGTGYL